jgi:sortase A
VDDLMSKFEHKPVNHGGDDWLGELLILFGILLLGLAVIVSMGPVDSDAGERAEPEVSVLSANTPEATPIVVEPATAPSPVSARTPLPTTTAVPRSTGASSLASTAHAPVSSALHPTPTPTPALPGATHIAIPAVGIDTGVVDVGSQIVTIEGQSVRQLQVADYAAGHDALSANPGAGGNIVISGHDDWKGEVFKNLHNVKLGDLVLLTTPQATYHYVITEINYRRDVGVPLADRLAAGQYLAPMPEERVTLVTCWPYGVDTHRLIVVAKPATPAP